MSENDTGGNPPTDENGLTYAVITEGSGPFETGELLVCAPLSAGVREVGYPSRKPLKWDAGYELFGDVRDAVDRSEEARAANRAWVPSDEEPAAPEDLEAALEALERGLRRKALFHLRRHVGRDTEYEEVGGHLFKPGVDRGTEGATWGDTVCQVGGCEMSYRELAGDYACPTPLEAYDMDARINDGF